MANKIEKSLSRAFEDITPDVLDEIFLHLDQREQANRTVPVTEFEVSKKRTAYSSWKRWAVSAAAVLVMVFGGLFLYGNYSVDSTIHFDVNPSIELTVNRNSRVLAATALNEDAEIILDSMDLRKADLDVAVNALIGSMLKHGYLTEISNSILLSVENNDAERAAELQQRLSEEISHLLSESSIDGSVISQSYTDKDSGISALAKEYNISYSKAELIDKLLSINPALDFAEMAKLSVNDINLLIAANQVEMEGISANGHASAAAYIGLDTASEIALRHTGLTVEEVIFTKAKLDYEHGRMIYEIEFRSGNAEYDYEIDAVTGDILEFDSDSFGSDDSSGTATTEKEGSRENADAREAADDREDMQASVDAQVGEDTQAQESIHEPDEDNANDNRQQENSEMGTAANGYIGTDAATSIALAHAGFDIAQVNITKIKLKDENSDPIYDIKFTSGQIDYKYEIHALTGEILKAKPEND